jgi:Fe-S cluster assembly iron-binding protein IscA
MKDISKLIKEEKINYKDQTLIDFLHELSLEKIKIDNPKY